MKYKQYWKYLFWLSFVLLFVFSLFLHFGRSRVSIVSVERAMPHGICDVNCFIQNSLFERQIIKCFRISVSYRPCLIVEKLVGNQWNQIDNENNDKAAILYLHHKMRRLERFTFTYNIFLNNNDIIRIKIGKYASNPFVVKE